MAGPQTSNRFGRTLQPMRVSLMGASRLHPAYVDPNIARPAKQYQWSIGLQREINRNLVVEASYVANRGVWWPIGAPNALSGANTLSQADLNLLRVHGLHQCCRKQLAEHQYLCLEFDAEDDSGLARDRSGPPRQLSRPPGRRSPPPIDPALPALVQRAGALASSGAPLGKDLKRTRCKPTLRSCFSHGLSAIGNTIRFGEEFLESMNGS